MLRCWSFTTNLQHTVCLFIRNFMTYLYTYIHSVQIIKQGERSISIYIDVKGLDIGRACMHPLLGRTVL